MSNRRTPMSPSHGADPAESDALLAAHLQMEEVLLGARARANRSHPRRPRDPMRDQQEALSRQYEQESLNNSLEQKSVSSELSLNNLYNLKTAIESEILGQYGFFKANLQEKSVQEQIQIIEYLISKDQAVLSESNFSEETEIEAEVKRLDELNLFTQFTEFLKRLLKKENPNLEPHLPELRKARVEYLIKFEDEEIYQKNTQLPLPKHLVERRQLADLCKDVDPLAKVKTKKTQFIENLTAYLNKRPELSRGQILDLFNTLRNRDAGSPYAFIHEQKYAPLDWCRLWFKSNANGDQESYFWHTDTYQAAVNLLKRSYESRSNDVGAEREQEEKYFIDYKRGNAPIHWSETSLRQSFTP